jgi:hypothetical protein
VGLTQIIYIMSNAYSYVLKLIWAKSNFVHVGNVDIVNGLACILDCGVSSLPLKYLGLPLGGLL